MLKIGHRGASGYLPENSISSFRKAIELKADGIELDVHLCKSGEPVVIHDETVDRTTNGKGTVATLTLSQLRSLEIAPGETIPTLEEVLQKLGNDIHYFIEIKAAEAALPVADIMSRYAKQGYGKLHIISFNHEALHMVAKNFKGLSIGASFEEMTDDFAEYARAIGAYTICPNFKSLTAQYLEQARQAELEVIAWTANESADIEMLKELRVDGIISDYPDRL